MPRSVSQVSLLWKILLSTSIAVTLLLAITGWIVQDQVLRSTAATLEDEVRGSFNAYESLWRSRAEMLASVSLVLSRMPDVRAAFSTGDKATIRDTAGELWEKVSRDDAIFIVTDPKGNVIASLGGHLPDQLGSDLAVVRTASKNFPRQVSGFTTVGSQLYQIAVTPVYVDAGTRPGLLNVLVAGYRVDQSLATRLKHAAGGSEFVFVSNGRIVASTSKPPPDERVATSPGTALGVERTNVNGTEYVMLRTPLLDIGGEPVGELRVLRSFQGALRNITELRRNLVMIWLAGIALGLAATYVLARRILEPVRQLDRGASEIARGNYSYRVPIGSRDELGRLARAFNAMCESVQESRQELIRQERISTIGRLATSIVHDLRNPLAAIYGGSEMLTDSDLSHSQLQRLAKTIYRSSRHVQELLQELVDVARGRSQGAEVCRLKDIVQAAWDVHASAADAQAVTAQIDVPDGIEVPVERARIERVFLNLIDNALEVMPSGGSLHIVAEPSENTVLVSVQDTGPGIAPEVRAKLFQPFVTAGKKNGVGLGLALSHQTILDHGGELWADDNASIGARFLLRLPSASRLL